MFNFNLRAGKATVIIILLVVVLVLTCLAFARASSLFDDPNPDTVRKYWFACSTGVRSEMSETDIPYFHDVELGKNVSVRAVKQGDWEHLIREGEVCDLYFRDVQQTQ